jgi:PIN domain nuclease of toxin-antitoxin system
VVTAWKIALLYKKGRLHLALPPPEFVERAIRHHGVQELSLTREVSMASVSRRIFTTIPSTEFWWQRRFNTDADW